MLIKNNKKCHDSDGVLWAMFIIMATAITFFVALEIFREKSDVFSLESAGMTASVQNTEMVDVSVMIVPVDLVN